MSQLDVGKIPTAPEARELSAKFRPGRLHDREYDANFAPEKSRDNGAHSRACCVIILRAVRGTSADQTRETDVDRSRLSRQQKAASSLFSRDFGTRVERVSLINHSGFSRGGRHRFDKTACPRARLSGQPAENFKPPRFAKHEFQIKIYSRRVGPRAAAYFT